MSRFLISSVTFTVFAWGRSLCAQPESAPTVPTPSSLESPGDEAKQPLATKPSEPLPETQPNSALVIAPVPQTAAADPGVGAAEREAEPGTAGVYQGVFFIRDRKDALRLYVQGRAMIDFYSYYGPGVSHVGSLNPTFLLRKVRLELGGELYRRVQWFFGGDFGMNSTALGGANQSVAVRAAPTDVYINYKAHPLLNVEVGQFDLPFTAETRTSDKFLPFIERSVAVRVIGKGNAKDTGLMLWGNLDKRRVAYALSVVQGDGMNRPNVDHRFDLVARAYVRPFAGGQLAIRDLQLGGSVRRGSRDQHLVNYDYPAMTTAGGYTFWKPSYGSALSASNPGGQTHVIPSGAQTMVAAELRVPTDSFDFTFEGLYGHENTREAQDVIFPRASALARSKVTATTPKSAGGRSATPTSTVSPVIRA